jgi:hypothetical protein
MVKIGNIVNYGVGKFSLEHFHVFENLTDVDNDLPTLLVGFSQTKKHFGELNFFDNKLRDNLFWTCNRMEDRYNYNKDLGRFIDYCEEQLTNSFEYLFINPFELKLSQIKRFIRFLRQGDGFFITDGPMVYIWVSDKTFGFNLDFSELFGVEPEHILRFLMDNGYRFISESEVQYCKEQMGALTYDLSELLFLKEKFAIT